VLLNEFVPPKEQFGEKSTQKLLFKKESQTSGQTFPKASCESNLNRWIMEIVVVE